jgi:hypothetical protein
LGGYDWVVLQEQSTLPIKNAQRMKENVLLFEESIRESGARMGLYVTWARSNTPQSQAAITAAYRDAGAEAGATLIPVGPAWAEALERKDHPMLHDPDGSHPSLAGSYLAACVFFGVLFNESPVGSGVEVKGLDPDDARMLQEIAREVVDGQRV